MAAVTDTLSNNTIHVAAEACYAPHPDDRYHALVTIIEALVLPPSETLYTVEQMEDWIWLALKQPKDDGFSVRNV